MKKTWECSHIEVIHSRFNAEEPNQILDEWAEIVYRHLCQLSENQPEVPEFDANAAERTGTNG